MNKSLASTTQASLAVLLGAVAGTVCSTFPGFILFRYNMGDGPVVMVDMFLLVVTFGSLCGTALALLVVRRSSILVHVCSGFVVCAIWVLLASLDPTAFRILGVILGAVLYACLCIAVFVVAKICGRRRFRM